MIPQDSPSCYAFCDAQSGRSLPSDWETETWPSCSRERIGEVMNMIPQPSSVKHLRPVCPNCHAILQMNGPLRVRSFAPWRAQVSEPQVPQKTVLPESRIWRLLPTRTTPLETLRQWQAQAGASAACP